MTNREWIVELRRAVLIALVGVVLLLVETCRHGERLDALEAAAELAAGQREGQP